MDISKQLKYKQSCYNLNVSCIHVEDELFMRICMRDMTEERLRFVQEPES